MAFTRERAEGLWIQGSVIDPIELEHIDRDKSRALDAYAGGTYAPLAAIILGGAGLTLSGTAHQIAASARLNVLAAGEIRLQNHASGSGGPTLRADGTTGDILLYVTSNVAQLDVENGAVARIKSGGALDVFGSLTFKNTSGPGSATWEQNATATFLSGSTLTLASGSTTAAAGTVNLSGTMNLSGQIAVGGSGSITGISGALILFAGGSTVTLQGTNNLSSLNLVGASTWVTFTSARPWTRHTLHIGLCTYGNHADNGPVGHDAWVRTSDLGNTPCIETRNAEASGDYSVLEFLDLPEGGTISEIEIDTKGASNAIPVYPTYQLVRWQTGDGTLSALSSAETDVHDSAGNWDTVVDTTTVTPSVTTVVDRGWRYGIKITHPYAVLGSSMRVYRCVMTGTLTQMKA